MWPKNAILQVLIAWLNVKLSRRLQTIAEFVPQGAIVADVGSDHGLLPEYLLKKGIAKRVFGVEVNPGPQARLKALSRRVSNFTDVRGDGLAPVEHEVFNCVCMSGLGGIAMRDIFRRTPAALDNATCLVLQPNNKERELRRFLLNEGWGMKETLVEDAGVWYEVWKCTREALVEFDLCHEEFGMSEPWRHQPREFVSKWTPFKEGLVLALQGLHRAKSLDAEKKKREFQARLELVQLYIHRARMWNDKKV